MSFASVVNSLLSSFGMNFGEEIIKMILFPVILIFVIAFVVCAFWGYKLYKLQLGIYGASLFGLGGFFAGYFMFYGMAMPIDIPSIIGFVCAIVGAFLMFYLFRISMALIGTAIGFLLGAYLVLPIMKAMLPALFATGSTELWVVGVCTFIFAALFTICYRFVFITVYSVGGMTLAGLLMGLVIFPFNVIYLIISALLGFVAGIFAEIRQYRSFRVVQFRVH